MKRFLLAGISVATLSAAAFAFDGEKQETRVRVEAGHNVMIGGDGPIIELRGENGERTLHIERDGEDSVITVNGQTIEIEDGEVRIDGQVVEARAHSVVVVEGDDIRVVDGDFEFEFDQEFAIHMAERAEHLARMGEEMRAQFHSEDGNVYAFSFDTEGLTADVMATLEATLEGLEMDGHHFNDSEWDDLTEEEREEVRQELREAREEIREAMREVRIEMAEMESEMEGERRQVRMEVRRAAREMAEAQRELARAEREHHRIEIMRRLQDGEAGDGAHYTYSWSSDDGDEMASQSQSIRVEEDTEGRRRVWVDGEEQTGDDLIEWLNQLESDRLAGAADRERARHDRMRRVERLEFRGEAGERRVIELDGGGQVVVEIHTDDEDSDE
ncbi:hypothetical protein [Maricaulis parjimensis]|uniref:hypothetical protein n=1 Tax=Maricaulis parjimensis TaxID=144023 RepID=UPI001939B21B|nr:hypothetical protein [Maricaulis parjimensis]